MKSDFLLIQLADYREILRRARIEAKRSKEICGIVIRSSEPNLISVRLISNRAKRHGCFQFENRMIEKYGEKKEIISSFHSHVVSNAVPSKSDLRFAFINSRALILDSLFGELRMWRKSRGCVQEEFLIVKASCSPYLRPPELYRTKKLNKKNTEWLLSKFQHANDRPKALRYWGLIIAEYANSSKWNLKLLKNAYLRAGLKYPR